MMLSITFVALLSIVAAQGMAGLPDCAKSCVTHSIPSICGIDIACICKSEAFLDSIACCVADKCSKDDQDATLSAANSICAGGGVTDLPKSIVCSVTAAITTVTPTSTLATLTTSTEQTTMETIVTERTTKEKTDATTEALTTVTEMTTKVSTSANTEAVTTKHLTTTKALTTATSVITSNVVSGSTASATSTATSDASLGINKYDSLMAFAGVFALMAFLV